MTASKKEAEPDPEQPPRAPPPGSNAEDAENKRWKMAPLVILTYGGINCSDLGDTEDPVVMWAPCFRPKTGFQLWLEENRKGITAGRPDLEETDVIKEAMGRFRMLSAEERLVAHTFRSIST